MSWLYPAITPECTTVFFLYKLKFRVQPKPAVPTNILDCCCIIHVISRVDHQDCGNWMDTNLSLYQEMQSQHASDVHASN